MIKTGLARIIHRRRKAQSNGRVTNLQYDQIENDVLTFWFEDDPEEKRAFWFERDPEFDTRIVAQFTGLFEAAEVGELDELAQSPTGCLALVIVLDQFPRNMFRDDPRAFATDAKALALSREAIAKGLDKSLGTFQRQFLYMPFQHSENLDDQQRSIELSAETGPEGRDYAQRHLDIIERFGRFPHRNAVVGRDSTADEIAFLKEPNSSF